MIVLLCREWEAELFRQLFSVVKVSSEEISSDSEMTLKAYD